jgi:hypothetical protein
LRHFDTSFLALILEEATSEQVEAFMTKRPTGEPLRQPLPTQYPVCCIHRLNPQAIAGGSPQGRARKNNLKSDLPGS